MRIWPLSPSLNAEIGLGLFHWLGDQIRNVRLALLIWRSKRVDRFVEQARCAAEAADRGERPGEGV